MLGYEIKTQLKDVTPANLKELTIPSDITFKKLHEIISIVYNLNFITDYKFTFEDIDLEIKDTSRISRDIIDSRYEKIDGYFKAFKTCYYTNDSWQVTINVKTIEYNKSYPVLTRITGLYNPRPEIKTPEELSLLIEFVSQPENNGKLKFEFKKINRKALQKQLMFLFNVPYKVVNGKIVEVKSTETLDKLFE